MNVELVWVNINGHLAPALRYPDGTLESGPGADRIAAAAPKKREPKAHLTEDEHELWKAKATEYHKKSKSHPALEGRYLMLGQLSSRIASLLKVAASMERSG